MDIAGHSDVVPDGEKIPEVADCLVVNVSGLVRHHVHCDWRDVFGMALINHALLNVA